MFHGVKKSEVKKMTPEQEKKNEEILEGIFSFCFEGILNLMDLKIFIDVDNDIQLSRIIYKDLFVKKRELHSIIEKYHKFVKPGYNEYILPTRKFADIILQKVDETSINIISEYLRMQLHKILKEKDVFSFMNEIIDQKYSYYNGKIIVENEKSFVSFIKQVFLDLLNSKLEKDYEEENWKEEEYQEEENENIVYDSQKEENQKNKNLEFNKEMNIVNNIINNNDEKEKIIPEKKEEKRRRKKKKRRRGKKKKRRRKKKKRRRGKKKKRRAIKDY